MLLNPFKCYIQISFWRGGVPVELCRGVHPLIKYFATCLFNLLMESKLGPGIEASHGEGIFGSRACAVWSFQKEGGETMRGKSPDGVVWLVWVWA